MKKIMIFAILIVLIFFSMLKNVNANGSAEVEITNNKYSIKKGEEIVVKFGYNEKNNDINVYKATLEYNEDVFEEVKEEDFKTLNNWTELKYNKNTREFITINKKGSKQPEDVVQITLKTKENINIKKTNIKIKDILVSEGKIDTNINEINFEINIIENNIDKEEIQEPSGQPEQEIQPDKENKNNSDEKEEYYDDNTEEKQKEDDNLAIGILPNTGLSKSNMFICFVIIILLIIALINGMKYKKINKKNFKIFMIILIVISISIQPFIKSYATNNGKKLKGNLNQDSKINYEDVELLQLHLIHLNTLSDDIIKNVDMNEDGKITITDLAILITNIESKKDDNNKNEEENYNKEEIINDIDYTETLDNIQNPERGFYTPVYIGMKQTNNTAKNPKNNLVHLRVGIGDFSGKVNAEKQDKEFTEDMLNSLNETLKNIKKNNGNVIIRFAYDNFEGIKDVEPDLEMILTHISQLETVFNKNKDVISYVELGFFGPWGEMHSSSVCTTENVTKAIDKMLEVTPTTMKIGVRTPQYYAAWKNVDRSELNKDVSEKGTDSYRIGLYNDGYLGSESDLGTFKNREIEISWLEKQAVHTLYGGEVVANSASGQALNTTEYISTEGFRTHTTYLNSQWNNTVIDKWKTEIYNGYDSLYKGQTGYIYIANHLGYRLVLRNSKMTTKIDENRNLKIKLQVENVGFGNVVNDKKVTIVLEKNGVHHEINTNIDVTTWNSKEITNIDLENILPEEIDQGNWKVYLRISKYGDLETDNNYNCIRFANNNIWNENIGANYIGTIEVLTKSGSNDYRNTTSMYSWRNQTLVKNADIIYETLKELKVNTLYQSIETTYMKKEYLEDIIKSYTQNGIEVHRLIGDPSWAYDSTNAKKKIDEINEYNKTVEDDAKIKGVNLDIEPHADDRWDEDHQKAFTQYKNTMIELYNYAKTYNLHVTICTNVWFNKYEGFEELYEKTADTYSIMNYVKNTNISGIKEEIEIAKKYNKKIETISHTSAGSNETESYHNDSIDELLQDQKEILKNYSYSNLRASFHHFTTIEYLKDKYVYLDLKLEITDNSEFPNDLILITNEGEEKRGYIAELNNKRYYMFPKLKENTTYKVKCDTHELVDAETITIPESPKGRATLNIKIKKKIIISTSQIGIGGCGCTDTPIISPYDSKTMIVLTDMGGFFVSNNSGETWERKETKGTAHSVTFDKNNKGVIYVGGSGLYKSTDNGKTFEMIFPNPDSIITSMNRYEYGMTYIYSTDSYDTYKPIRNITINPNDSNNIFIAQYDFNNGVVLESKDGGNSFDIISTYKNTVDKSFCKMFLEDDGLIYITIEGIFKYNFTNKITTKLFVPDVQIVDIVKAQDNYILVEKTNNTYQNYETIKTKVTYTKDFESFTDITEKILNSINKAIKDYKNTTEALDNIKYDELNFKINFSYIDATSLDNIYLTNENYENNDDYINCLLNYRNEKVNFIYGYPFKTYNSLENEGWRYLDECYEMYGVTVDSNNKDKILFTTLCGIYYYNNGKLYQRNTNIVEEQNGDKTYVTNGMDMQTTYSLKKDPFNVNRQLLLNTDLGLIYSENNGETWTRKFDGIKHEWINTVYDLEFDKEKEGVVYSVWSSRHDAPYVAYDDEITNVYGGFAISYDSGKTWDSTYSSGLPEHINPVKISIVYNDKSKERTIYLTSFNLGTYVSYDSGKTFSELNKGIEKINDTYIFGADIEAKDGKVFMLTARTVINNEEQNGKVYELKNGSWKEVKLNEKTKCPRDIYYHNGILYISATACFKYDWTIQDVEYRLVGGGIYTYDGKNVKLIYDETSSIAGVQIDSKGTLYASDIYGNIYVKNDKYDFKKIYSDYHYISKGLTLYEEANKNVLYLATFGGGMLKLELNKFSN